MSMLVPDFWAEANRKVRQGRRTVAVRRFGWSDTSQDDAQRMADERADAALAGRLAGKAVAPRDIKVPYNGAEGVPIREQVVSRHGDEVITRNSYGALCLNSPRVLFADVDCDSAPLPVWGGLYAALALILDGWLFSYVVKLDIQCGDGLLPTLVCWMGYLFAGTGTTVAALVFAGVLMVPINTLRRWVQRMNQARQGGLFAMAQRRVADFVAAHPGWGVRVYRTPAGLRLLATHRAFDPAEPEVTEFFQAVGADPMYVTMCRNQHCFRARLSAKPWRIGMQGHLKPRPGVWPVNPDHLPERTAWLDAYDARASAYAACRFETTLGHKPVALSIASVVDLHDELAQATRANLPLA